VDATHPGIRATFRQENTCAPVHGGVHPALELPDTIFHRRADGLKVPSGTPLFSLSPPAATFHPVPASLTLGGTMQIFLPRGLAARQAQFLCLLAARPSLTRADYQRLLHVC